MRTYTELSQFDTFQERYDYLRLTGRVGFDTFGHERWMNQKFYGSREWKQIRYHVIARDMGNDLGVEGYPIFKKIHVHHMNPMMPRDLIHGNIDIIDPEFLITVSHDTHNAIHYGAEAPTQFVPAERTPGDTTLW